MTHGDFKYMKEAVATDLAEFLTKDYNMGITTALEVLYNSKTYEKLNDPTTGLYFQSPHYVYSYLKDELKTGVFG